MKSTTTAPAKGDITSKKLHCSLKFQIEVLHFFEVTSPLAGAVAVDLTEPD